MPCHRNFSITDPSNQICPLLTALDFHNLCPAFLHKACSVANGIFRVNLVRPVRHVRHQQRGLHASTNGLNVMQLSSIVTESVSSCPNMVCASESPTSIISIPASSTRRAPA